MATATCQSASSLFRKHAPNIAYQAFCNHRLFDSGCALNASVYEEFETVALSGSELTHATFGTFADDYFTGGTVEWNNHFRLITNHVGNTITLHIPLPYGAGATPTLKAFPGCDKNPETCVNKFNNLVNFLGFPGIPGSAKNPAIIGFK